MSIQKPLDFSKNLLKQYIRPGDTVIDATVGNGNDTVFLASLVEKTGHVIGFDIQETAINNTYEKLLLTGLSTQVTLYQKSHQDLSKVMEAHEEITAAVFNLGYLPRGDKSIITQKESTLKAIDQCLKRLAIGGCLSIMVYHGHPGGEEEKDAVLSFVESLPQDQFQVLSYGLINQINNPPFLLFIERIK